MAEKKYELTNQTIEFEGRTLYRIRALTDIWLTEDSNVSKGQAGGWVESEANLSQEGNCWVCYNAVVVGHAQVSDDAFITDHAVVADSAKVSGGAVIQGNAKVLNHAWISDHASLSNDVKVKDNAFVGGHADVFGESCIRDEAKVSGACSICGKSDISGNSIIFDKKIYEDVIMKDNVIDVKDTLENSVDKRCEQTINKRQSKQYER